MIHRFAPRIAVLAILLATTISAQQVELPHSAGTLTVPEGWTALGAAELKKDKRDSDPKGGMASMQFAGLVRDLQENNRTEEHVVLHRFSATDNLLMINCYSTEDKATSAELTDPTKVKEMSAALTKAIGGGDIDIECVGTEVSDMFAVKSLIMRFGLKGAEGPSQWRMDVHVVPNGNRLAYFESQYLSDDEQGIAAIASVLKTYTGAVEPTSSFNVMVAGLAGAMAGILTAVLRRRRQIRRQAEAGGTGSAPAAG